MESQSPTKFGQVVKQMMKLHPNHPQIEKLNLHDSKIFMVCCMDFRFVEDGS